MPPIAVSVQDSDFVALASEWIRAGTYGYLFNEAFDWATGWKTSPWLGNILDEYHPWIYSQDHGWIYILEDDAKESFWYWDSSLGWLYSTREVYPKVFRLENREWYYFFQRVSAGRYFYRSSIQ